MCVRMCMCLCVHVCLCVMEGENACCCSRLGWLMVSETSCTYFLSIFQLLTKQALEDGNLEEATQKGRRRKRRREDTDGDLVCGSKIVSCMSLVEACVFHLSFPCCSHTGEEEEEAYT